MRIFLCLFVILIFLPLNSTAQTSTAVTPEFEEQHRRAVDFAHKDQHDKSLSMLRKLLKTHPTYYPVLRDYVIISTWNNDCDDALKYYKKIAKYPDQESYLIIPVSECMVEAGQLEEAKKLLQRGYLKYPNDKDLKEALNEVQDAIDEYHQGILNVDLVNDNPDGSNIEWRFQTKYTQSFTKAFALYGRYFYAHSSDEEFPTEDMDRLGIGAVFGLHRRLTLDQEFSTDIKDSDKYGSTTKLNYDPHELWDMNFVYSTYWEDLSLRAVEQGVKAKGWNYNVYFHTGDYRWEWFAAVGDYQYTDGNDRASIYTEGGYAFELTPKREQRVILELNVGKNSVIPTAAYFNPERSSTIALAYKLDMVLDTKYRRHVDTLYVNAGVYSQKDYDSKMISSIFYQQDYDLNKTTFFNWGLGVGSKVYDGERETNLLAKLNFEKRF